MTRLLAAVLAVLATASLTAGCSRGKKSAVRTTTTTASTAPPVTGRGLAGVPGLDGGTTGTTGPGGCFGVPAEGAAAETGHPDLPPLPEGTRWLRRSTPQPGQTLLIAAIPETLPGMQKRIREQWFPAGWRELAGESEPGREVEGVFQRQDVRIGMRARVLYCDTAWLEFRVVVNR